MPDNTAEIPQGIVDFVKGKLAGKTVGITGGGRGLGRAIALGAATAGANVVLLGRTATDLEKVAEDCRALGVNAQAIKTDVTDDGSVGEAITQIESEFGRLDGWVNNAGVGMDSIRRGFFKKPIGLSEVSVEDFRRIVDTNLTGSFICIKHAVPLMTKNGGGSIVSILTGEYIFEMPGFVPYGQTKLAILAMSRALGKELTSSHIRLNGVTPGAPSWSGMVVVEDFPPNTPIMRPNAMIPSVIYLLSDDSGTTTGDYLNARRWNVEHELPIEEDVTPG